MWNMLLISELKLIVIFLGSIKLQILVSLVKNNTLSQNKLKFRTEFNGFSLKTMCVTVLWL